MVKKAILALGSSLLIGCASIGMPRVPSLDCDDVIETERHGTIFYSCQQDTTQAVLDTFDLIGRVKEYGKNTFGFPETVNYRQYINTNRQQPPISYRLYVSPKDNIAVEPEDDIFLIAPQEYREDIDEPVMLWSKKDDLLDEEQYYSGQGFDTYRRAETNYSPGATITPDFLEQPVERQIYLPNHEDRHFYNMVTLGNSHARNLEEPFATIFGHAAAIDFIKANYGTNSQAYANAIKNLQKWRDLSDAINISYSLLDSLYSRNLPWEEAEPIKQEIINRTEDWSFFPLNNAKIQGYMHYTWHFPLVWVWDRIRLPQPI